jgi:hypothetical protein
MHICPQEISAALAIIPELQFIFLWFAMRIRKAA